MSKVEEFIAETKLNDLLHKKEAESQKNKVIWVLAIIGAVAAVAGIAYAVYRFFTPDYLEEFEDDFDDDFDDYFSEDDQVYKTLMPALQSPWFAPHVIVYMFSYAMLGAAALIAIYLLIRARKKGIDEGMMSLCDNLVYVGMAFLTIGMLFGALWAKEAWGHYWNWDPKETWAAATWLGYLIYIHYRLRHHLRYSAALGLLVFSFLLLQVCWIGVNYLPSARGYSVHTYNME